jgi:hypothetical protein
LIDPANPLVVAEELLQAAQQAENVLLVWFVGHGLVDQYGTLHLATYATRDLTVGRAAWQQTLPYEEIREAVRDCRAASIVIVLDCCFAGRATAPATGHDSLGVELATRHSYLLTSAAYDERALAPPDEPFTMFTGAAIRLLRDGDPSLGPTIRLQDLYRQIKRRLQTRGGPEPQQWTINEASTLVLARNLAFTGRVAARSPLDKRFVELSGALQGDTRAEAPNRDARAPWPGLAAYGPDDADLFHGRAALINALVTQAAQRALYGGGPLALVGSSGAGKSSLLAAGLLPAIGRGELGIAGSAAWRRLSINPGADPVGTLAACIAPAAGTSIEQATDLIRAAPTGLTDLIRRLLHRRANRYRLATVERLVLVVDQFEELFTVCDGECDRNAFIEALCVASGASLSAEDTAQPADHAEVSDSPPSVALVVLGIRADFYGHAADHAMLRPALTAGQVLVGPMTPAELEDALRRPALETQLTWEGGLLPHVLRELSDRGTARAGNLPLLSHAMAATWAASDRRTPSSTPQNTPTPNLTMPANKPRGASCSDLYASPMTERQPDGVETEMNSLDPLRQQRQSRVFLGRDLSALTAIQ